MVDYNTRLWLITTPTPDPARFVPQLAVGLGLGQGLSMGQGGWLIRARFCKEREGRLI